MPSSSSPRLRLADVAQQAGVSTATVLRVLNGKEVVAEETRRAVLAALDVLGFPRPGTVRRRPAGLVGLVVPELTNPVFPAIAQEAEALLTQAGYTTVLCTQIPGGTTEDEYIEMLAERGVAGILFVSGRHADTTTDRGPYQRLRQQGVAILLMGGFAPEVDAPQVSVDEAAATGLAVRHLVAQGHRRIGLALGPERFTPSRRKRAGFLDALVSTGLAPDARTAAQHVATYLYTVEGGQAATRELIAGGHTAIVCASDLMALGAIRAAQGHGLRVPEDLSVVGYDDSPLMAFTQPPLTTIRQPVRPLCRLAVGMLLAEIRGEHAGRTELLVEPELVVRGSTGIAPRPAAPERTA